MNESIMLVLKKKKLKRRKRELKYMLLKNNKKTKYDPLFYLYQMDNDNNIDLNKEVVVLIKRLLYNVEEFYYLKDMISEIMDKDEKIFNVNEFFENLLKEVRSEEFSCKISL